MSFDYKRSKQSHNGDSFWTSYSDLFLGLSTIFLLLYVTASLRTGTDAIQSKVENQKLAMQVEELQSQLKMYENVKQNYMETQASKSEVDEYQELMDKLTLLREDAKTDAEKLARQSLENEKKAQALNKYQQLVRNMINANKMQKSKVLARNGIIEEQDTTIDRQKQDIRGLETDVADKRAEIARNQAEIAQARQTLLKSKKSLLAAFRSNQLTKAAYENKVKALETQSQQKIQSLQAENQTYASQLDDLSSELKGTQSALQLKNAEAQQLVGKLEQQARDSQAKIDGLRAAHDRELAAGRAALDAEIRKGQMDAAERARREGEFRAAADRKERELAGKIAGLSGQLKSTEGALAKAKEEMDARREIAREIQRGFAAAGVKADVDMQTGEVVLDFGDQYFDSDSANLKVGMKKIIERAMPVYSKSLFGNPKVAGKISAVEVIGFASPTYKGRFVDPSSGTLEDKTALKYNMDLSYRRANSIFAHLLENKDGGFAHEKDLIALMKVSGRSFLEVMKVQNRGPASAAEFCKQNDCKKAQRVIVRFSMDGKK